MNDKITIITICYNAEKTIQKTLDSVYKQNYNNIQYIIKDGCSKDRTNEIIESNIQKFRNKNIEVLHISKPDTGIYDAMNQAIEVSNGRWINFMNSDDIFVDENVLNDIFKDKNYDFDILYGDSICEYQFFKDRKEFSLWIGDHSDFSSMPFSHQACFVATSLMKTYMYDISYKSAGDYNFLLKCYKEKKKFFKIKRIVSLCTMDGVSNTNLKRSYIESCRAKRENAFKCESYMRQKVTLMLIFIRKMLLTYMSENKKAVFIRSRQIANGFVLYDNIKELVEKEENI